MISYTISYHISSTGRRAVVTAAEMTEFEKQAECLGWAKVQVFKADHGENYSVLFFIGLCCNIETHHKYYYHHELWRCIDLYHSENIFFFQRM